MSKIKPIGSEKLPLDEKIKRINEIANYNAKKNEAKKPEPQINESLNTKTSTIVHKKTTNDGVYVISKEKDGYYVKFGLNESKIDYIEGLMRKNKNRFNSHKEALKRLELITRNLTEQDQKYVLKNEPENEGDEHSAPAPSGDSGEEFKGDESGSEDFSGDQSDKNFDMGDEEGMGSDGDYDGDDKNFDDDDSEVSDNATEEPTTNSVVMKQIHKTTGKLCQQLRDLSDKVEGDDIKYVLNSIFAAVDLSKLSPEDKEDITKRFEDDVQYDEDDMTRGYDSDEDSISNEPSDDDEVPSLGDDNDGENGGEKDYHDNSGEDFSGDDQEKSPAPPKKDDEDLGEEFDEIYENFSRLEKLLLGEVKKDLKKKNKK